MSRATQAVVLTLVGTLILRISLDGTYLRYVKPHLQPFLVAAGASLLLLGVASMLFDEILTRASPPAGSPGAADDESAADQAHLAEHEHGAAPKAAWLLCLPVLAILLIAPPALGAYAAQRAMGTVGKPPAGPGYPALPGPDPVRLPVSEYAVRAIWDYGHTLAGRTVVMTGFVTPRPAGGWFLTRMVISCCAADAQAYKVEVRGAPPLPADTWVEVTGTWADNGQPAAETSVPVVVAARVTQVHAPRDPYDG